MKISTTFTADATKKLAPIRRLNRDHVNYVASIFAYGTWGSGTLAFYISPDSGSTLIPITSTPGGTGASLTANGMLLDFSGVPATNSATLDIYATLSGSTNPSLTVDVYDNNG